MVAISGIQLLKMFMDEKPLDPSQFKWLLITHFLFIISGVFLAITDFISVKTKNLKMKGE